jgi:hypothetical protein
VRPNRDEHRVPDEAFEIISRLFTWRRLGIEVVCLSAIGLVLAFGGVDPMTGAGVGALLALCLALFEILLGRYRIRTWRRRSSPATDSSGE